MPRIVARGIKKEDLKKVSAELFDTIAGIIERPREAFTLDLVESVAILDGEEISRANIEIGWVERPVEVCEKVANAVGALIKPLGYEFGSHTFSYILHLFVITVHDCHFQRLHLYLKQRYYLHFLLLIIYEQLLRLFFLVSAPL